MKERILQLIDFKLINKSKFYLLTGLSNGFLDKSGSIGVDKLEKILISFPDINPEWLLIGKGEMLREKQYIIPEEKNNVVNESNEYYGSDILQEKNRVLKYEINVKNETIEMLREKIRNLQDQLEAQLAEKKLLADIKKIN